MTGDSKTIASEILERLRGVLGHDQDFIPLHAPEFCEEDEKMVLDCLRSGWVSSVGQYVDRFEAAVAQACGASHAVAVVNGTAALEVALRIADVRPGDEVLMPSLTFVATANAAHHLGAVPHFVDVDEHTMGIDPLALRAHLTDIATLRDGVCVNAKTGRRLLTVVPMHAFGHPVNMDELKFVADEFGLTLVEDAAEALGSLYKGRPCGGLGQVGAISFNGNKILTTGGGGAIVTNDPTLARRAKHLTTTAKSPHPWSFFHDEIGYNYRLPNLNAALGVAQLTQIQQRVTQKRKLAEMYIKAFSGHDMFAMFSEPDGAHSNYWLNTLLLAQQAVSARDEVLEILNHAGFMSRPVWEPLHRLEIYADCPRADLPMTASLASRIINLPSSASLGARLASE